MGLADRCDSNAELWSIITDIIRILADPGGQRVNLKVEKRYGLYRKNGKVQPRCAR